MQFLLQFRDIAFILHGDEVLVREREGARGIREERGAIPSQEDRRPEARQLEADPLVVLLKHALEGFLQHAVAGKDRRHLVGAELDVLRVLHRTGDDEGQDEGVLPQEVRPSFLHVGVKEGEGLLEVDLAPDQGLKGSENLVQVEPHELEDEGEPGVFLKHGLRLFPDRRPVELDVGKLPQVGAEGHLEEKGVTDLV